MVLDPECWIWLVGDPGNTPNREEIEEKAWNLTAFQSGAPDEEMALFIARTWNLDYEPDVYDLLPRSS